jgi:hypothetical protein
MVDGATHELPGERPDVVIKAIQEVLSSASGG